MIECVSCGGSVCHACMVSTRVGFKCASCTRPEAVRPPRHRARAWALLAAGAGVGGIAWAASWLIGGEPASRRTGVAGASPVAKVGAVRELPVRFRSRDGVALNGTLDLPPGARRSRPAVLVIPGFGPTTRDGVVSGSNVADPLYRDLGRALTSAGMVALRYDKRSSGGGRGERPPLDFRQYVSDAGAALALLRLRPEVDARKVAVVGHDEGGLVAMRLAARPSSVQGLVLISTPGRPLAEVLAGEIRGGAVGGSSRRRERLVRELGRAVRTLRATGRVPALSGVLRPVLPRDEPRYLTSLFALDPAAAAAHVRAPVLIVRGARDPGIRGIDVRMLRRALRSSGSVTGLRAAGAGHTLSVVQRGVNLHGHGGSGARVVRRDSATLRRITRWLGDHAAER